MQGVLFFRVWGLGLSVQASGIFVMTLGSLRVWSVRTQICIDAICIDAIICSDAIICVDAICIDAGGHVQAQGTPASAS